MLKSGLSMEMAAYWSTSSTRKHTSPNRFMCTQAKFCYISDNSGSFHQLLTRLLSSVAKATYMFDHFCLRAAGVYKGSAFISIYRHLHSRQHHIVYLFREEAGADIHSPESFPWYFDKMCPILLHRKHRISGWNLHVQFK